jgi:peptidoglycan L-alanyl-D-glutamate endopeptidase CwlK
MPKFSEISIKRLDTCEDDLQTLFNTVILKWDCRIIYGIRDKDKQFDLWKSGREYIKDEWVITNIGKVLTYKDGINTLSKHNYNPSRAVDVLPYPVDYKDIDRIIRFAGFVEGVAWMLKRAGLMTKDLTWGVDWDSDNNMKDQRFMDYPHFELK